MKLLVIGYGKMGSAIVKNWISKKFFSEIIIIDPNLLENLNSNIKFLKNPKEIDKNFHPDIILIAIKPQNSEKILQEYSKFNKSLIISIMAGKEIKFLKNIFNKSAKIARIMPNLCATIAKSTSLICYSSNIDQKEKSLLKKLCNSFGSSIEIKEKDFHLGTILTGCSPAFFYLFCEKLSNIFSKIEISKSQGEKISADLFLSSATMYESLNLDFKTLQNNIASKGGITEATLKILDKTFENGLNKAIKIGIKKSKELSK